MNKTIILSVIIATYNSEKTINKALQSVRKLDFDEWECIVIDGLSSDDTVRIVEENAKADNRIRYISEFDLGIYDAFNKGWKLSKGEWIFYLGSDDILLSNGIKRLIDHSGDSEIIYGNKFTISHNGERILFEGRELPTFIGNMVSHQSLIMRRDVIERLGGFDVYYKICGDYDLIQRAAIANLSFKYVDSTISIFQSGGISGRGLQNIVECISIQLKYGIISVNQAYLFYLKQCWVKLVYRRFKYVIIEVLLKLFPKVFATSHKYSDLLDS